MSAAIYSVSFHVIRSSNNSNEHLYCSIIQKAPVKSRSCSEHCKYVMLNTKIAGKHETTLYLCHKVLGPLGEAASAVKYSCVTEYQKRGEAGQGYSSVCLAQLRLATIP